MHAVVALSTSPKGFTASDLSRKVSALNSPSATSYTARQAAYDLRKLRRQNRKQPPLPAHTEGPSAMAALAVLREKVIKPMFAASCHPSLHPETQDHPVPVDQHYETLRSGMRGRAPLGIAA
jgi:hypothetical protein